jgi:hypothetical protein
MKKCRCLIYYYYYCGCCCCCCCCGCVRSILNTTSAKNYLEMNFKECGRILPCRSFGLIYQHLPGENVEIHEETNQSGRVSG